MELKISFLILVLLAVNIIVKYIMHVIKLFKAKKILKPIMYLIIPIIGIGFLIFTLTIMGYNFRNIVFGFCYIVFVICVPLINLIFLISKDKINEKLKDSTDTMVIKGMYAKDELDDKIEETKKNLDEAKEELNKKKEELNEKINKLGKERSKYRELEVILKSVSYLDGDSINSSIDDDITSIKKEIALYESIGCSRYMDISACLNIRDGGNFIFPLDKGCVSQDYLSNHKGIDLACNGEGTNVYSSAKGVVSSITYKATYGGNIVYIYHIIGGKQYTTIYGHLLEVKVNVGDVVDTDTVIGLVGGESTAYINGGYDKGTKGAHLHYVVVEGFHVNDFSSYTLNPRYFNTYPGVLNGYFRR